MVRYVMSALLYFQVPLDNKDMYEPQAEAFVEAVRTGNTSGIRSLYMDAVQSFKASQWITAASTAEQT